MNITYEQQVKINLLINTFKYNVLKSNGIDPFTITEFEFDIDHKEKLVKRMHIWRNKNRNKGHQQFDIDTSVGRNWFSILEKILNF